MELEAEQIVNIDVKKGYPVPCGVRVWKGNGYPHEQEKYAEAEDNRHRNLDVILIDAQHYFNGTNYPKDKATRLCNK